MEKIYVEASSKTPSFLLDPFQGLIEIKGRSIPENVDKTYGPAVEWFDQYLKDPQEKTIVNFHFEYVNSSTTKVLMQLINKLLIASKFKKTLVELNWYYSDDDILEYGEDFEDLSGLMFNFIDAVA